MDMDTPAPQLTPARKRLIRQAYRDLGMERAAEWLHSLPSFRGVSYERIRQWAATLPNVSQRRPPAPPAVTQATSDPGTTGEWYSTKQIAVGLEISVQRVYAWALWGWLRGGPLYTAADIRAFVRAHPMEIKHRDLSEASWLWLVSVLAGSREGAAS